MWLQIRPRSPVPWQRKLRLQTSCRYILALYEPVFSMSTCVGELVRSGMKKMDDIAPDWEPSSSTSAAIFCFSFFVIVFSAWWIFRSPDFKFHSVASCIGFVVSVTEATFIQSGFPTAKLVGLFILAAMIVILPWTVSTFRGTLLRQVKKYVDVY